MISTGIQQSEGLDADLCWELLRSVGVGRLAVIFHHRPEIFPVNHIVDGGTIVFRTADGTKLTGVLHGAPVAFEVDGYDEPTDQGWSVVVKGQAVEIRQLHDLLDTVGLPLAPWHGDPKNHFVRITADAVTGRRFPIADPGRWNTELSRAPHTTID